MRVNTANGLVKVLHTDEKKETAIGSSLFFSRHRYERFVVAYIDGLSTGLVEPEKTGLPAPLFSAWMVQTWAVPEGQLTEVVW